ncbi:MAG: hypothetical protein ACJ762_06950 [Solirubrobacteraceae bacterium]
MVAAVMAALAGTTAQATAATRPVYRDPPSYAGVKTAPKTVAAPAPQAPPPLTLSEAGSFPDVLVDEAGTAHIVWDEDRGDLTDVVVYCRLPRGASACETRTELRSDVAESDQDARYDSAVEAPRIVQSGDQLLVFSKRYPYLRQKPDGGGSSSVIAWSSGDGGTNWTTTPSIVGKWNLGQTVVIGGDEEPTILTLGVEPFCNAEGPASLCLVAYRSGQYSAGAGNLSTKTGENYNANLTLDENGLPVMSAEDLDYDTYVRRWTGTGSPLDATTWTPPSKFPGDQSSIAGGPSGVYLMAKPKAGSGAYSVSRLTPQGDTYARGAARAVSPDDGTQFGQLFQGPDGRLLAVWQQRSKGLQLRTTTAAPGERPTFGGARTIVGGDDNGQIALDAAADGGGFTAYNHTGFVNHEGQVQVGGFGTQIATGKPGIADVAGGGIVPGGAGTGGTCGELSFGAFTAKTAEGCLLKGKGARSGEYVTSGELNLWGVRIIPEGSAKIVIDPKRLQLDTTGVVRVVVTAPEPVGDVTLFRGELHRDLSKVVPGTSLFEFPTGLFKASILGFDVAADIDVRLERDGVHIPLDLKLPPALGGFSGHAEFVADKDRGLHVDSVHIHIGPLPLGVMVINAIDLDYVGGEDLWTGTGSITVPAGGTLDLMAQFQMGAFKSASFSFTPGTPIPIGPFVYLLQFGGGLALEPTTINANATIGAGAALDGQAPIKVKGDLTMTFPSSGPADFRLKGTVGVFMFDIADGSLDFQTDGYAAFRGHAGVDLGPLEADVNMDGFVDAPSGRFGASLDGSVSLCVEVDLEVDTVRVCGSVSAAAAVSSVGFAACARINPPDPVGGFEVGLSYPWSDWDPAYLLNGVAFAGSLLDHIGGCHVEDYRIPPPRARAAQADGSRIVDVPAGLPSQTIRVTGAGGAPHLTVTGPNGEKAAVFSAGAGAAYAVLDKPAAGAWTVTPKPGSPAIAQIMTADGYRPATVRGKLGGTGRRRSIRYTIAQGGHGQTVVFQESGAFGTHIIGAAKGAKGTLRFAPADAKGGRRTVVALVQRGGITTDTRRIGTYTAPGPARPGKPRGLKARRAGNAVVVSFAPSAGAARYAVTLRGVKGTRLGRLVSKRKLRFDAVSSREKVTVSVRGLSKTMRLGPARRITLRAR